MKKKFKRFFEKIVVLSLAMLLIVSTFAVPVKAYYKEIVIKKGVLVKYNSLESEVRIPDGVKEIGDHAFEDQGNMVSIYIPDSVKNRE